MPKVTAEYLADKRKFILECTEEVLKEKSLYLITMGDIIKKAGFSQGAIYRYYVNLDEIYIDFINKHTGDNHLEQRIDALLSSKQPERTILTECFVAMGEYIEELLESVGGKTFFELIVYYSFDLEKTASVFPRLKYKQNLDCARNKIVEYGTSNIDKGIFKPQVPIRSLIQFVNIFIDGVAQMWYSMRQGAIHYDPGSAPDISEMFRTLAKAVINFLEG